MKFFRRGIRIKICVTVFLSAGLFMLYKSRILIVQNLSQRTESTRQILVILAENETTVFLKLKSSQAQADNLRLISAVERYLLEPPDILPYNLTVKGNIQYSRGQSNVIDEHLNQKENGYFIEFGANDGEKDSVSLFFEMKRKWKGLLIEQDSNTYKTLRSKHRFAHTMNACVSQNISPALMPFHDKKSNSHKYCIPLYSIILATKVKTVDLLSINVNGKELNILRSIPFDKVDISVISIKEQTSYQPELDIIKYMKSHGYSAIHKFINAALGVDDIVFSKVEST